MWRGDGEEEFIEEGEEREKRQVKKVGVAMSRKERK